ncbi:hypothetical protein FRB99_004152 [Tulasnella sp. 403]|nr:hypothetical protein FRB99_004152 [Tulasnella sp. 403]
MSTQENKFKASLFVRSYGVAGDNHSGAMLRFSGRFLDSLGATVPEDFDQPEPLEDDSGPPEEVPKFKALKTFFVLVAGITIGILCSKYLAFEMPSLQVDRVFAAKAAAQVIETLDEAFLNSRYCANRYLKYF